MESNSYRALGTNTSSMFASCGEKITNHKFFWQPSCNPKSTTKLQPTLAFFAMHMGIMLQPDSIIRCKQAQQNNCRLAHTTDYYPRFCFFAMHMVIMLQPEGTLCCKQAQHNNCILAHTTLLPFFSAMHMGIMLQPEGTLRCKQARQIATTKTFATSHTKH
jgi:hypothetical protein